MNTNMFFPSFEREGIKMDEIIVEIVDFVKSGQCGTVLGPMCHKIDSKTLNRIFQSLLFWMLVRDVENKSLFLMTRWQKLLGDLIETEPALGQVFDLNGDHVDYAENIDVGRRAEMVAYIRARWLPKVAGDPKID